MPDSSLREFLKFLALLLVIAYSMLFTLIWVNAYTFGYQTTIYINQWGEAFGEGLAIFGFFWPVVTIGLYFLAVDGGLLGERDPVARSEETAGHATGTRARSERPHGVQRGAD